jgi:hypothetical protein
MRQTVLLAGLCLWGTAAFAADPALLNLVMPNAKVLAGVNVASALTSPFGQFVLGRIATHHPSFPVFFDPRTDLTELLFASAADPTSPGGLILASGTFNVTQIAAEAANHPHLAVQSYDGYTLIVTTNPKAKVVRAVAFINNSVAVAGDVSDVEAALDRSTTANSIDPALAAEVNTLSTNNDAWIASSVGPPARKLQALQAIQSFEAGVMFGANAVGTGQAVANSPQNAAALANVIQLLGNVRGLQGLQTSAADATVNLSLRLPEAQIEEMINGLAARRRQARPSGQARQSVR